MSECSQAGTSENRAIAFQTRYKLPFDDKPDAYFPLKFGARLLRKASMPSRKSSLI
jgi:hypothetical protein